MFNAELLARIQFAFTAGFHFLYPPMSIGLALILTIMEGMYLRTKNPLYEKMTKFWLKVFALTFAVGVATGIVMEFEFGTNWSKYSRFVGDIFGSPLAAEGIFAFFLESTFLGILLFGWKKVSAKTHFISAIMVTLGATLSAFWIIAANSWMQTPAGFHIVTNAMGTRAEIVDFWAMVFNPSTIQRFTHTVIGAWLTGAFMIISVSAYYLLKKKHVEFAKSSLKVSLIVACVASLLQLAAGHSSSMQVADTQPVKLAAFEAHFDSLAKGDMYLFGIVDEANKTVHGIALPGFLSFLVNGDFSHKIQGLNGFQADEKPPVQIVFQTYHIMITLGMAFIAITLFGIFLMWRGKLWETNWFLKLLTITFILPHIANLTGWIAAEVGRQPWIVQGLLKTKDAFSPSVTASQIWFSLVLFTLIYSALLGLFIFMLMKKIKQGPEELPA